MFSDAAATTFPGVRLLLECEYVEEFSELVPMCELFDKLGQESNCCVCMYVYLTTLAK